jgi:hypothetical protein
MRTQGIRLSRSAFIVSDLSEVLERNARRQSNAFDPADIRKSAWKPLVTPNPRVW